MRLGVRVCSAKSSMNGAREQRRMLLSGGKHKWPCKAMQFSLDPAPLSLKYRVVIFQETLYTLQTAALAFRSSKGWGVDTTGCEVREGWLG